MKKSLVSIFAITVFLLASLGPALFTQTAQAADPTAWYMTVNGVLATDTYSLYPYNAKSLKLGFSKFGELIDSNTNVGLEYGVVDPFSAPAGSALGSIPKSMWLNGWLVNITYYNVPQGKTRNVWATALFADATAYGGSWIRVDFATDYSATYGREDPRDPGYIIGNYGAGGLNFGGRKTNGTAVTGPITVLYNGPRLFVAVVNTTIYDHPIFLSDDTSADLPLARVQITIVFNKVKKEVVLLKDVKSLLTEKVGQFMLIQFSNRGEVDLGTEAAGYHSYFHFYTEGKQAIYDGLSEGQSTGYDRSWTVCPTDPTTTQNSAHGGEPGDTYDVAQAVNPTVGYVWWAAFWPSLSDWTIDGWPIWWKSMTAGDPHYIDAAGYISPGIPKEPKIPYYIGEWDFTLYAKEFAYQNPIQFRGVTVYGVTDRNNGDDAHRSGGSNVIDREARYQLDEVFNPWDLQQAVEKKSTRWVEYFKGPAWKSSRKPVMNVPDAQWDQYCVFSERVEDLTTGKLVPRTSYTFRVDEDGYGYIKGLTSGKSYKILYSTDTEYANWGPFTLGYEWIGTDELGDFELSDYTSFEDWLGAHHAIDLWAEFTIEPLTELEKGDKFTLTGELEYEAYDFKVFKEGEFQTDLDTNGWWYHEDNNDYFNIDFCYFDLDWYIEPPSGLDLHVDILTFDIEYEIFVICNGTNPNTWNVTATFKIVPNDDHYGYAPIYAEHIPGRYEWVTVGRDAHSVDSVGSALVSAAFKNKQVEIGLGGMDMMGKTYAYEIPYVLRKFGTGNAFQDYFITPDTTTPGQRLTLKDDWCREWPISSSNMIAVGGPLANWVSMYFNDFTSAFYGAPWFTPYAGWSGKIAALSCWNKNAYANTGGKEGTGYATIGTYKDINGTVGIVIWGLDARDTYYATKFFHEEIIFELQEFPRGATSIIIKIDYTDPEHPTFTIPEVLGTISETCVEGRKGGIHDP